MASVSRRHPEFSCFPGKVFLERAKGSAGDNLVVAGLEL